MSTNQKTVFGLQMLVIVVLSVAAMYFVESLKKSNAKSAKAATNNVHSVQVVRAGLSNALEHVRAEMAQKTNQLELEKLRSMEHSISNSISKMDEAEYARTN
jgi:hypothetical protein